MARSGMERLRGSLDAMGEAHEPVRSTVQGVGFRLREEGTEFPFLEGVEAPPGHLWTGGGQGEPLRQGVPRSRVAATPVPGKRAQTARPALPGDEVWVRDYGWGLPFECGAGLRRLVLARAVMRGKGILPLPSLAGDPPRASRRRARATGPPLGGRQAQGGIFKLPPEAFLGESATVSSATSRLQTDLAPQSRKSDTQERS